MDEEAVDRDVRQDVADVLVRYATAIDQKDWTQFRTCFTDDCEADYGAIGVWRSVDEITEWMAQVHDACGHTMHRISNVAVSPGTTTSSSAPTTAGGSPAAVSPWSARSRHPQPDRPGSDVLPVLVSRPRPRP